MVLAYTTDLWQTTLLAIFATIFFIYTCYFNPYKTNFDKRINNFVEVQLFIVYVVQWAEIISNSQ
jgi:hypothetical protein